MKKFYYHLKATNSENVGDIEAETEEDALQKLADIYTPKSAITGRVHKGVDITLISKTQYNSDEKRIAEKRKAEATATVEPFKG